VKPAHPAIKDRQNAVRTKIKTADGKRTLFVNPVTAEWCHKGLGTVQLEKGSTFQEDQKNKYQHITTAIGYCVDREWPSISRRSTVEPFRM
jgi:5-deoxy-D-glucuronate isomerase